MEFWSPQIEITHRLTMVHNVMKQQIPEKSRFSGIILNLVDNPGKMIRPALLILCAGLEEQIEAANHLSAALEYLHMASLVHDDIVDGATERRGRPSVVSEHGLSKALYTGDYLIWLAVKCLGALGPDLIRHKPADFMSPLLEAEVEQLDSRFSATLTEDAYLKRIEAKTGLLFALAASAGLGLKTQSQDELKQIKTAGLHLGIAFQLRDDLMDLEDPDFGDLKEGNFTHPVLSAVSIEPHLAGLLSQLAQANSQDTELYQTIVATVRHNQGPEITKQVMGEYVKTSTQLFSGLLGDKEMDVLQWMNHSLFGGDYES